MPATKISDLLPLADGAANPHPYQVFGLDDGEQDTATITAAVKGIVRQLKAAKSETDSQLWNQAAKLVQDARVALADPEKKAQLDARFGIIQIDDVPATHGDPLAGVLPSADPLAAVLPTADPLASVLPSSDPLAPAQEPAGVPDIGVPDIGVQAAVVPPGIRGNSVSQPTDSESSLSDHFDPAAAASTASPVIANTGIANPVSADTGIANSLVVPADEDRRSGTSNKSRRRKRPVLGMLMFGTFALGMVSIIGALVYFLAFGSGRVEITSSDGQLSFSTDSTQGGQGESVVSQPRAVSDRPKPQPLDSVMGSLAGNSSPPNRPNEPSGLASSMQTLESPPGSEPSAMPAPAMNPEPDSPATPETMPAEAQPPMDTPPMVTTPEDPGTEPAEPPMETEPVEPPLTDAMIAEAEKALQNVRELIRSSNWKEMKGAAEGATEMRMNESQQAEAEALYEVADLASYYRVGIERAVNELSVGNDFEVTDDFRVIVVEKGDDLLVVRYNEKNRSFTFDEFPFSLAHKLASFSVSDSPTGEAAKAVYQSIAPKSTEAYRTESLQWLRGINGEVEEADPKRMADTIAALFAEDA